VILATVPPSKRSGKDERGKGMIINSARGIIFASKGADFAEASRRETLKLDNLIDQYRQEGSGS
jgi:orotidine-5'-phosphate decarboxylase